VRERAQAQRHEIEFQGALGTPPNYNRKTGVYIGTYEMRYMMHVDGGYLAQLKFSYCLIPTASAARISLHHGETPDQRAGRGAHAELSRTERRLFPRGIIALRWGRWPWLRCRRRRRRRRRWGGVGTSCCLLLVYTRRGRGCDEVGWEDVVECYAAVVSSPGVLLFRAAVTGGRWVSGGGGGGSGSGALAPTAPAWGT
jgi:hypothetical protein